VLNRRKAAALIALSSLAIISADTFLIEPNVVLVEELRVKSKKIPKYLRNFKIAQISDIHLKGIGFREEKSYEILKSIKPNLIVVTGDLIDDKRNKDVGIEYVKELSRISEVMITFGNWEHWSLNNLKSFKKELEDIKNVKVLNNKAVNLKMNISIIGVDDPYTYNDNLNLAMKDVSNYSFKILLAHSPQIIDKAVDAKIDLVLCGHTHGGQVAIPLLGPPFVPLPKKYRKYIAGNFIIKNTIMHVNRGLGTAILPIRFLCPAEITILLLSKA
jgi:hypothetical protein